MVSGGNLTLRNVDIEETDTRQPAGASQITGGTVDLGTAADPGGNTFNAHGHGELIHNAGGNGVSAVGNTFQVDGATLTSPYRIKDEIFDALNAGGGGLVTYVPGQRLHLGQRRQHPARRRCHRRRAARSTWRPASYKNYDVGSKLVTVAFENGPVLTQQADPLDPSLRSLVVTGTAGQRQDPLQPGRRPGGTVRSWSTTCRTGAFSPDRPAGRLRRGGRRRHPGRRRHHVAGLAVRRRRQRPAQGRRRQQRAGGRRRRRPADRRRGPNLLIGGSGADTLIAGSGDDLLIAGTTAFDANEAALAAIMAEWTSGRDYATRVANLSGTGSGPRSNGNFFLIA